MKKCVFLCLIAVLFASCSTDNNVSSTNKRKGLATVYIMAGQSNMEGNTHFDPYLKNYCDDANKDYQKYLDGFDGFKISYYNHYSNQANNYSNEEEPMQGKFVDVKLGEGISKGHFGPEIGLCEALEDQNTSKNPIFLIKYCSGGTSFKTQARDNLSNYNWTGPSDGNQGYLYTGLVEFVRNNLETLEEEGYEPYINGILWMQGESDSDSTEANANAYGSHLSNFIKDLREEFSDVNVDIPFIDAEICAYNTLWRYQSIINNAKKSVAEESPLNFLVNTNVGTNRLDINNAEHGGGDIYHYTADSMIRLGNMFANVIIENNLC